MNVLILGCGWVGKEFAKYAISKGCAVVGTTTRPEKCQQLLEIGVRPIVHDFDQDVELALDVSSFDYVLNSVPAPKKTDIALVSRRFERVVNILEGISFNQQVYLSSVGIYPDTSELLKESYEDESNLDRILLTAEKQLLKLHDSVVYRLGGLFGKDRIFAKYFQDRVCTTGDQRANFIHVEDVVRLIWLGFRRPLQQYIYNIVTPDHPSKRMVIEHSADKYGFRLPKAFAPSDSFQKIVDGSLIAVELDYRYTYPSPLMF